MRAKRYVLWISLAIVGLWLTGCGQVRVSEPLQAPGFPGGLAADRPEHDLAVLAVEVDPPLDSVVRPISGAINFQLLVAVENRGDQAERDVIVEAWLKAPNGRDEVVILNGKTIVPYLAPGEVKVAKVSASGVIPMLSSYLIVVTVRPVPSETYVGNNTSQYQVTVSLPAL
ncbi:MAG: hypothetical protein ACUVWR_08800 [Anaerolineae bacterium]